MHFNEGYAVGEYSELELTCGRDDAYIGECRHAGCENRAVYKSERGLFCTYCWQGILGFTAETAGGAR
jgi:Rieske Fe-S protein